MQDQTTTTTKTCKFCGQKLRGSLESRNGKHPRCALADAKRRVALSIATATI
jgi:hypothetical protein